jgi:sulfoxide reductase heme-binding subunit YedZ
MTDTVSHPVRSPALTNAEFSKLLVFINALIPLALLLWDIDTGQVGPDKVTYILHTTGLMALICLMFSLAVTPLRLLTGMNFFMHFRRLLGLFAFFYAALHVLAYLNYQRGWDLPAVVRDVFTVRYIFFGLTAFVLMIPLALTSTAASVKRLGAAKWKRLHQLVYLTAICAVIHFYLLVKADERLPLTFILILAVLLAIRILRPKTAPKNPRRRLTPTPK